MIYESAYVLRPNATEDAIKLTKETVVDQYQDDHELKEKSHVPA